MRTDIFICIYYDFNCENNNVGFDYQYTEEVYIIIYYLFNRVKLNILIGSYLSK